MTLQSPIATLIPLFSSSALTGCGYPGLLDRKNRSDMCSRWESNPRLPACKASTLSTRPDSPLGIEDLREWSFYMKFRKRANGNKCEILFIMRPFKMGFYRHQNEHYFSKKHIVDTHVVNDFVFAKMLLQVWLSTGKPRLHMMNINVCCVCDVLVYLNTFFVYNTEEFPSKTTLTRNVFQIKTEVPPPFTHSHPYFSAFSAFPPNCFIVQIFFLLIYSFKFDVNMSI